MFTAVQKQSTVSRVTESNLKSLYLIGGVAAILQLVTILAFMIVSAVLGPRPETARRFSPFNKAAR